MSTRMLLFDFSRLDGTGTGPHTATVLVSLLRPQQDNATTVTTTELPVVVEGPTLVEVPVTAPGNALVIQWPAGASPTSRTYHLIGPGETTLVAATMPLVDKASLAPTAHPEAAWWEAVKGGGADLSGYVTTADLDAALAALPTPDAPTLAVDNGDGTLNLMIGD